jgi:hypothetical protein
MADLELKTQPLKQRLALQFIGATTLLLLTISTSVFAQSTPSQRQKVIDFEDELVEGMNRRPLDSLSQISEKDKKRRKHHIYRKRTGFKTETGESLRVVRYTP